MSDNPPAVRRAALALPWRSVLGEREATVLEVTSLDVHGVGYADVVVTLEGGRLQTARLGAESIPEDLRVGERVLASMAANMIVAIRRP